MIKYRRAIYCIHYRHCINDFLQFYSAGVFILISVVHSRGCKISLLFFFAVELVAFISNINNTREYTEVFSGFDHSNKINKCSLRFAVFLLLLQSCPAPRFLVLHQFFLVLFWLHLNVNYILHLSCGNANNYTMPGTFTTSKQPFMKHYATSNKRQHN